MNLFTNVLFISGIPFVQIEIWHYHRGGAMVQRSISLLSTGFDLRNSSWFCRSDCRVSLAGMVHKWECLLEFLCADERWWWGVTMLSKHATSKVMRCAASGFAHDVYRMARTPITIHIEIKKGRTVRPHWQLKWSLEIKHFQQILTFTFVEFNFLTCWKRYIESAFNGPVSFNDVIWVDEMTFVRHLKNYFLHKTSF